MADARPMNWSRMLEGRTAVITAAASGMGLASARLFGEHGAHVIIVDRDGDAGTTAAEEITRAGGSAECHVVDLLDPAAIDGFFDELKSKQSKLDVLFNHAGAPSAPGLDFDAATWEKSMAINLRAPMLMTRSALPLLRKSDAASIVFTSSVSGLAASPFSPLYSTAKGGVVLFMKSLAVALGPEGIRANAICPGPTATPMLSGFFGSGGQSEIEIKERIEVQVARIPLRRLGEPTDVAKLALFLASSQSSYITGVAVPADGGFLAG